MSQSRTSSILGATPYRNPRHEAEAAALEEHDKSIRESQAQGQGDTENEVQPEHNWEKRYKDLQSYTAKKINSLESENKDLRQQGVQKITVPKTQEELEAFKGQNPEVYAVIQSMASNLFQEHIKQYDQKLADMQGQLNTTAQEKAKLKLKEAHPDYEQILQSDQFHDWAATQTTEVQDWIYKNPDNADLAIQALSLFKYNSGWGNNQNSQEKPKQTGGDEMISTRQAPIEPGATDRNHPAYMWKESEIAKMRPEEFGKWEQHISLAQREGRILFGQ